MIRHIALFKLKSGLTWDSVQVRAAEELQEQVGDKITELRSWHCGRNISAREIAYDYAIMGLVDDADALARYLAHPFHRKVAESWSLISDRVIADVLEEPRWHRGRRVRMYVPSNGFVLTDTEYEMLPSDADVEFYAKHGWYLSKKLFSDEELDLLRLASEEFYAGKGDRVLPRHPARLAYWTPEQGSVQRHNDYIHYESDTIASVLRKSLLGAVAARLARTNQIRVFQATLIYKPPQPEEPSNVVPWHFDRDYWATSTSERMLTAFIPFHHCDERMGTITMIDGSHLWKEFGRGAITARHFVELDSDAESVLYRTAEFNGAEVRKTPMVIPAGHVSFHHCRTYHGSGANLSTEPRRAISLHLQDGENAYREFRLADGGLAAYNHDELVRKTADGKPDYADPAFCPVVWEGQVPAAG